MKVTTRREAMSGMVLGGITMAGSAIALSSAKPLAALSQLSGGPLAIPRQPMRLSRVLTRDLRGKAKLRVLRDWQVEFAEQGSGITITGAQISARVEAPSALAQLAELEQKRDTSGMFPLVLSDTGLIVASGSSIRDVDFNEAVLRAQSMIADRPLPEDEKAQHRLFLAQLQRSGASLLDQMPPDLFFPGGDPVRSTRAIDLPGGLGGEFEMIYEAFAHPGSPWLHRAIRKVVTRIGADERRSIEEWSLEALGAKSR